MQKIGYDKAQKAQRAREERAAARGKIVPAEEPAAAPAPPAEEPAAAPALADTVRRRGQRG